MTKIIINRTSEYNNRLRDFKIYINDNLIGEIANGETKQFDIEPGKHKLIAKIDWCSSQVFEFETIANEDKTIEVSGFKYGNIIIPIIISLLILHFIGKQIFNINTMLLVPAILGTTYPLYYITFGKNRYLRLFEKTNN